MHSDQRPNVLDANVAEQLYDPLNLDFRARPGSKIAAAGGAGPYGVAAPEEPASDCGAAGSYWIPGRREWRVSTPIPPAGATDAAQDLALMFLVASVADRHVVSMGPRQDQLAPVGPALKPGCNVQLLSTNLTAAGTSTGGGGLLPYNSTWFWRVDAQHSVTAAVTLGPVRHQDRSG